LGDPASSSWSQEPTRCRRSLVHSVLPTSDGKSYELTSILNGGRKVSAFWNLNASILWTIILG
jgi:hypothetical protein